MPDGITHEYVLLVEGYDDAEFMRALLRMASLPEVQVIETEGKANLAPSVRALVGMRKFDSVRAFGIVRDADESATTAFRSAADALGRAGLFAPKVPGAVIVHERRRVGIFVMPGQDRTGALEDLCLATVKDHPAMTCVENFMRCVEAHLRALTPPASLKQPSKAKVRAFLAGMPDLHKGIGSAATKGCWRLDHPALDSLKTFLRDLCRD